jgi:hypothetical protein
LSLPWTVIAGLGLGVHNKEATVRVILEKGGDYLIGTKANTSKRLEGSVNALKGSPFFT